MPCPRPRSPGPSAPTVSSTRSACATGCAGRTAIRCRAVRLRGRHAAAGGPGHGLALRASVRAGGERGGHRARRAAGRHARRQRARRPHRGDPARQPGAVPARAAGAAGHVPGARAVARAARRGVRAPGPPGVERRVRARATGWSARTWSPSATRHYWNDAPTRITRVHYLHHADAGTEFRQYRAGELDVTYVVPPQQFAWIKANLPGELHVSPQLSVYYYGFNLTQPPFKDNPGLRRALSMVIDRERLTNAVTGRGEAPAYGWVARGVANYTPQQFDYAAKPYAERVAEARELYAARGLLRGAAAQGRDPLQLRRGAQPARRGDRRHVEGSARRRDDAVRRGVPRPAAEHPGAQGHAGVPLELGRRLQRRLHLRRSCCRPASASTSPATRTRATTLCSRRPPASPTPPAPRAARGGGAGDAGGPPVLPIYFYVNKHLVKPYVTGWTDNVMNVQYSKDLGAGRRRLSDRVTIQREPPGRPS